MTISLLRVVSSTILALAVASASAEGGYTEGAISYATLDTASGPTDVKEYFKGAVTATVSTIGPSTITVLVDEESKTFAVLLAVPVAAIKRAGIAKSDEFEKLWTDLPVFSFSATQETKQISGFNCQKVIATDAKTGALYEVWITRDIVVTPSAIPVYFRGAGGFPIQYPVFSERQSPMPTGNTRTVTAVTNERAPIGTFDIPEDFDKVPLEQFSAVSEQAQ